MPKFNIIASDISNLTDARYFAAQGVSYVNYNLNQIDKAQVLEIQSWIEGLKTMVQPLPTSNEEEAKWIMENIKPDACIIIDEKDKAWFTGIQYCAYCTISMGESPDFEHADLWIIREENPWRELSETIKDQILKLAKQTNTFLDLTISVEELKLVLSSNDIHGLVIRGGQEELTGVKSFEEIDEVFEMFEDI